MKHVLFPALAATLLLASSAIAQTSDSTQAQTSTPKESTAEHGGASVAEMVFCASVQDRQPAGEATTFAADIGSVTCFTKITGVEDVAFNRLTSHDVVRHQLVGRIVAAYDEYDARGDRPEQGRPRA